MPLEEQASCFFFHHFVSDDPSTPIGYARFLPKIYNHESAYGNLGGIVTSIGLAGLSNLKSSPETMIMARKKHTAVLRSLNSSLQDPATAATDSTFLTVLLLGLFEVQYLYLNGSARYLTITDGHMYISPIFKVMDQSYPRCQSHSTYTRYRAAANSIGTSNLLVPTQPTGEYLLDQP